MKSNITATSKVSISAPIEQVWKALTEPALIEKYFFGTHVSSSWNVGSPITFRGSWQGKSYTDKGTIKEKEINRHLKYSYWSEMSGIEDKPENYVDVSYDLEEQYGKTILTVTQENVPTEAMRTHSEENWGKVLDGLKKLLEQPAGAAN